MKLKSLKTGCIVLTLLSITLICAPQRAYAWIRCCSDNTCWWMGGGYCSRGVLDFGTIDPSSTGPIIASITTNQYFNCSGNGIWNASYAPASLTLTGPAGGSIPYTIGYNATHSCTEVTETLLINTSTIQQTAYQDAPAGTYRNSATVTFTINGGGNHINPTLAVNSDVRATIIDTCGSAASGTMSFNIDPSGSGAFTPATTDPGNTSPSIKCTKNSTHAVSCSALHGNLSIGNDGTTNPIAYTVTTCGSSNSITGNGFSTATSIPIGISIPQASYQDAPAGTYTDTISVTITY